MGITPFIFGNDPIDSQFLLTAELAAAKQQNDVQASVLTNITAPGNENAATGQAVSGVARNDGLIAAAFADAIVSIVGGVGQATKKSAVQS